MERRSDNAIRMRVPVALCYGALCIFLICGCTRDTPVHEEPPAVRIPAVATAPASDVVVDESGQPIAIRAETGTEIPLEGGEALVGDWVYIARDDGQVEKHRSPNVIQHAMNRIPYLYLDGETGEHVVTDGFQGNAYVNPATRHLCWPALTCRNPKCASHHRESGDPFLFSQPLVSGARVGDDGELEISPRGGNMPKSILCPMCKSADFVTRYELPNEIQQRTALEAELARVRAARDAEGRQIREND